MLSPHPGFNGPGSEWSPLTNLTAFGPALGELARMGLQFPSAPSLLMEIAIAEVAAIIAPDDCPGSPNVPRTPSPSPLRVPPGLVGLHPRLRSPVAGSHALFPSPVYRPCSPGWRSGTDSPAYSPATEPTKNPFFQSNWVLIGDDWLVPPAPRPSPLTTPATSCRSSSFGSAASERRSDRSGGSDTDQSQVGETKDELDQLFEWSGGFMFRSLQLPSGTLLGRLFPEVEALYCPPMLGSDADADGITDSENASQASDPANTPFFPHGNLPFLSDTQVQVLLEPRQQLVPTQPAPLPGLDPEAYTRLYQTFARVFISYCQRTPTENEGGRIQRIHVFQAVSEEYRSSIRQVVRDA
ncbi:hypothetical protein PTTG_25488 [Puccinia triticina 1-1 BBBD Race 1]|uniref:Uncharacterized protein n=1 Tax=Puccinia triticina (isolate 1-1 / race 1 (BBBD)) TaxID=630390 RepID=A0A180H2I4_PUCT1|nr:hypothetical protein PTTG_25488 [Puccinia triticina 1-1 BBBD Race 1]